MVIASFVSALALVISILSLSWLCIFVIGLRKRVEVLEERTSVFRVAL